MANFGVVINSNPSGPHDCVTVTDPELFKDWFCERFDEEMLSLLNDDVDVPGVEEVTEDFPVDIAGPIPEMDYQETRTEVVGYQVYDRAKFIEMARTWFMDEILDLVGEEQ